MIPIIIILILILLNGVFVAAEFAIVGAPRAAIEHRAAKGHRLARQVNRILHTPQLQDRYIATAQLGITLSSLGLGMYGEHVLAQWFATLLEGFGTSRWIAAHTLSSILSIGTLTYFHIVIGEMVPKSIALQYAERAVLLVTTPMLWIQTALYPFVIGLNGIGNFILKWMGVNRQLASSHFYTTEELQYIVQESRASGLLRAEAGKVLKDLFEFGDLCAGEVMVPRVRVVGIPLNATPDELKDIVRTTRHTRYPVYDGNLDHIVGVIHIKDLLRLFLRGLPLSHKAIRSLPFVPETSKLDAVLAAMHRERTHMAVVMDEYGGTSGIVTVEDLFGEIVGDIEEGVIRLPKVYRDANGRLHVAGTMRVEEVGEHLDLSLEHEEVNTVSGLILALLDRHPSVGDTVTYHNIRFEVTALEGHGVSECVVTVLSPVRGPVTVPPN